MNTGKAATERKQRPAYEKARKPSDKLALLLGAAVSLISFLLYLNTLAPTVLSFDSASLQIKAYVLGIGHPTGYPTYIMLGKLFTYLPFGDVAYRVNLSSAVYAAAAIFFVYLAGRRLSSGRFGHLAAAIGALTFATAQAFWSQAVRAEVYTLNVLCLTAAIYALLLWRDSRREGYLMPAALLVGLAMTAHMTSGLLVPASLLFVFLVDRVKLKKGVLLLKGAVAFLVGLSPYAYLPIRASMNPPFNYADPSDLQGLLFILSGGHFKSQMFIFGPERLSERTTMYYEHLIQQFPVLLLAIAVLGVLVAAGRDRAAFGLLVTLFGGYLGFALEYGISDIAVYFLPTYLLLALFMVIGLDWLMESIGSLFRSSSLSRRIAQFTILLVVCSVTVAGASGTRSKVDQSGNYEGRRLIESVARDVPSGATVLGHRATATLNYMKYVDNRRKDLKVSTVNTGNVRARAEAAFSRGPTYFVKPGIGDTEILEEAGFRLANVEPELLYEVRSR